MRRADYVVELSLEEQEVEQGEAGVDGGRLRAARREASEASEASRARARFDSSEVHNAAAAHLRRVDTALLALANGGKVRRLQGRPVCHPPPRTVNVPQRLRQKHLIANRQGMRIKQHVAAQGMDDLARRLLQRRSLRQPLLLTRGQVERRLHERHATRHRTKAAQNKGGTEQRRRLEPALRTAMRRRLLWRAADAEARAT